MKAQPYDVMPGDKVNPGDPVTVDRYTAGARINHWITATSLVLLALSGLSLFHPSLFFLTALFGGGDFTRFIHPWLGVVLFFGFFGLLLRFWRANLWEGADNTWLARISDVLRDKEERLPEVGKYNAGQKMVFWSMSALIVVLITSGIVIWDRYFSNVFSVEQQRIAVLVHAVAAVVMISPVTEAAAITAMIRRAVVERCFMSGCPVGAWDPLITASFCPLRLR